MNRRLYFLIAFFIVGLDRLIKFWVEENLVLHESRPLLGRIFRLTRVHNPGGAFGIFPEAGEVFIVVAFVAIAVIVFLLLTARSHSRMVNTGLALILGGAAGNLIDRILFGHVLDYFEVHGLFVNNLADFAISIGAGLLVFYMFFGGEADRTSQPLDRL